MKTLLVKVLPHILASVICLVIFTATPIILYGALVVIGIIFYGDMGGLLNFILIPMFSVVLAIITTFVILLPIAATLQWLSPRLKLSRWIPLFGIFPASFIIFVAVAFIAFKPENTSGALIFLLIWCLVGSACFALYWIPLNFAETILCRLSQIASRFSASNDHVSKPKAV
jgi:hypothetical protein